MARGGRGPEMPCIKSFRRWRGRTKTAFSSPGSIAGLSYGTVFKSGFVSSSPSFMPLSHFVRDERSFVWIFSIFFFPLSPFVGDERSFVWIFFIIIFNLSSVRNSNKSTWNIQKLSFKCHQKTPWNVYVTHTRQNPTPKSWKQIRSSWFRRSSTTDESDASPKRVRSRLSPFLFLAKANRVTNDSITFFPNSSCALGLSWELSGETFPREARGERTPARSVRGRSTSRWLRSKGSSESRNEADKCLFTHESRASQ